MCPSRYRRSRLQWRSIRHWLITEGNDLNIVKDAHTHRQVIQCVSLILIVKFLSVSSSWWRCRIQEMFYGEQSLMSSSRIWPSTKSTKVMISDKIVDSLCWKLTSEYVFVISMEDVIEVYTRRESSCFLTWRSGKKSISWQNCQVRERFDELMITIVVVWFRSPAHKYRVGTSHQDGFDDVNVRDFSWHVWSQ